MPKLIEKKRGVPGKVWFMTWNNYEPETLETFIEKVKSSCSKYVGQEEVGENGTPHIQMKIECKKKIRPIEFFGVKAIHWEKSRTFAGHEYCNKDDTRKPGGLRWSFGVPPPLYVPECYGWQLDVVDLVQTVPDLRKIYWYWEPTGSVGKSSLARYLCVKHNALLVGGKASDMKAALALMQKNKLLMPSVIIADIPRSVEHVSFSGFEEIKNGVFFSSKYESGMVMMNSPHLIVFANFEPDLSKLSADRWVINDIRLLL